MAAYEAIRDSFREFNKTLIDASTWTTQHKLSAADTELKQTMLMNQINQQHFNNKMQQERLALQAAGNKQGADRLAFDIENSNRNYLLNKQNIEADNKHDLATLKNSQRNTNSLIEDRQARANMAVQIENRSAKSAQLANEGQRLSNEKATRTAAMEKAAAVPTEIDIPKSTMLNPVVRGMIEDEIALNYNGSIKDGRVVGPNGNPLKVPLFKQRQLGIKVKALEATYDNKPDRVRNEIGVLEKQQNKINSDIKSKSSIYNKSERANLKRQSNQISKEIENRNKFLAKLDTPQGMADYEMEMAKNIRAAASSVSAKNGADDPKAAAAFLDIADQYEASAVERRKAAATDVNEVKINEKISSQKNIQTMIKDKIIPVTNMMSQIGVESQQAMVSLNNMVFDASKKYGVDINNPDEARDLVNATHTFMIEKHNEYANEYQAAQDSMSKNEFGKWKNTKWIPKVKQFGFTYNPTKPYREEIGGQY